MTIKICKGKVRMRQKESFMGPQIHICPPIEKWNVYTSRLPTRIMNMHVHCSTDLRCVCTRSLTDMRNETTREYRYTEHSG